MDYPADTAAGGTGIPGAFTLSANGNTDIVAFKYGTSIPGAYIAANQPGGTATLNITPTSSGRGQLVVEAVDAGGNLSEEIIYTYSVARTYPHVACTPDVAYVGTPRTCTVTPFDQTDVGYTYQLDNGPITELAGGTVYFTVTPTVPDSATALHVRARLSNGNLTEPSNDYLRTMPGEPTIDKPSGPILRGQPAQFTFHAVLPGSTSFTYTWQGAAPVTVPVGSDGTTTVSLTADQPWSSEQLTVYSITADGVRSGTKVEYIPVDLSSGKE